MDFFGGFSFAQLPIKRFYKFLLKRSIGSLLRRDIDLEQLDIQLYKGIAQLKALDLNVEQFDAALASTGLLLHFASGAIGCVKMDIPWAHLLRDPCKVYIAGLHVALAKGAVAPSTGPESSPRPGRVDGAGGQPRADAPATAQGAQQPRYSQEGVETLSRLVKLILARTEVCVHDASLALLAPSPHRDQRCGSGCDSSWWQLRVRLSSAVVFSETPDHGIDARTVRIAGVDVLLCRRRHPGAGRAALGAGEDVETAPEGEGESAERLLASTAPAPGDAVRYNVLRVRRRRCGAARGVPEGVQLEVDLRVQAVRLALAPAACRGLGELLQGLAGVLVEGEAQVPAAAEGDPAGDSSQQAPSMARSLVESSMAGGAGSEFWSDLYSLFETDAALEDLGSEPQEIAEAEAEEAVDAAEVVATPELSLVGVTVRASVAHIAGLLALEDVGAPRPADAPLRPGPVAGVGGDQLQLCVRRWTLRFDRPVVAGEEPPRATSAVRRISCHLHRRRRRRRGEGSARGGARRATADEAEPMYASVFEPPQGEAGASLRLAPEEYLIYSRSSPGHGAASAAQGSADVGASLFASARSDAVTARRAPGMASTPSASSCHCSTTESVGVPSEEESFGHSSAHSVSDSGVQGSQATQASSPGATLTASAIAELEARCRARLAEEPELPIEEPRFEELFFDRSRPIVDTLLGADGGPPVLTASDEEGCADSEGGESESDGDRGCEDSAPVDAVAGADAEGAGGEEGEAHGVPGFVGGGWRHSAHGFSSRRLLHLSGRQRRRHGLADAGESGDTSRGHVAAASSSAPRQAVRAAWQETASADAPPLRVSCEPVVVSLCAESILLLAVGASRLAPGEAPRGAEARCGPREARCEEAVAAAFRAVASVPWVVVEVSMKERGAIVARASGLTLRALPCAAAEPCGRYAEAARLDVEDITLDLLEAGGARRLLAIEEGAGQTRLSIYRLEAPAPPSSAEEVASSVPAPAEEAPAPPADATAEWTKISVSEPSAVLKDLRHACRNLRPAHSGFSRRRSSRAAASAAPQRQEDQAGAGVHGVFLGESRVAPGHMPEEGATEVELVVPGAVQLRCDSASLVRLQGAWNDLAARIAARVAADTDAGAGQVCGLPTVVEQQPEEAREQGALLGCTARFGCLRLVLDDDVEEGSGDGPPAGFSGDERLQLSLAPLRCRFVQVSPTSLRLAVLGRDLRFEGVPRSPGACPLQFIRPWYRVAFSATAEAHAAGPAPRRCQSLVPEALLAEGEGAWREEHSFLLQVHQARSAEGDHREVSVALSRLVLHALPRLRAVLGRLARFAEPLAGPPPTADAAACVAAPVVAEGSSASDTAPSSPQAVPSPPCFNDSSLRVALLDCMLSLHTDTFPDADLVLRSQGLQVPAPRPPPPRGLDARAWRIVLHAEVLELAVGLPVAELRLGATNLNLLLSDHPSSVSQVDLAFDSPASPARTLASCGFAHTLNVSSAALALSASLAESDSIGDSATAAGPQSLELAVGDVTGHACADTLRCLLSVATDVAELLPAALSTQAPTRSDGGEAAAAEQDTSSRPEAAEGAAEEALLSPAAGLDFREIDLFAFHTSPSRGASSRPAQPEGISEMGDGSHGHDAAAFGKLELQSCLVDDFIGQQGLPQSPRPAAQHRCEARDRSPVPMELPEFDGAAASELASAGVGVAAEPSAEAGSVALYLVLSEEKRRELRQEDEMAMKEVERMLLDEGGVAAASSTAAAFQHAPQRSPQVLHQEGTAAVWFVDPSGLQVVQDHFAETGGLAHKDLDASRLVIAAASMASYSLRLRSFDFAVCAGADFEAADGQHRAAAGSDAASASRPSRRRQAPCISLQLQEGEVAAMVRAGRVAPSRRACALRRRLTVRLKEFGITDNVPGSVFSKVLACFEDERHPRPSKSEMLRLRVDEVVPESLGSAGCEGGVADEYMVDVRLLPLRLTVDQDAMDFAVDFVQLCFLPPFVEEPQDVGSGSSPEDSSAPPSGGDESGPATPRNSAPVPAAAAPFFRHFAIGPLLVSLDYKAKRFDAEALLRGEYWELLNSLPFLEGLQVPFRKVTVVGASGIRQVGEQAVASWSRDLNRTQMLWCLASATPIRSVTNIGGGFAEMVVKPLTRYRMGGDSQAVSLTLLHGVVSFLRQVAVEGMDLTEHILVKAHSTLEHATARLGEPGGVAGASAAGARRALAIGGAAEASGSGAAPETDDWSLVERGASHFQQPDSAAEGLQQASSSLTRGVRHASEAVVAPLLEFQRGAPWQRVLRSGVTAIPKGVLQAATGATAAATTALRGVRNSVDPSHRQEAVQKFKAPQ